MARRVTVGSDALIARLMCVFRDAGYDGASLEMLAEAAGLRKSSLYHRFPDGKEQMAREVLASTEGWLAEHVLTPLRSNDQPAARLAHMVRKLEELYAGGKLPCLLNILSTPRLQEGPFAEPVRRMFEAWINALTKVAKDAGVPGKTARARAERAVALVEGSLVLSIGTGSTKPFRDCLRNLGNEMLDT